MGLGSDALSPSSPDEEKRWSRLRGFQVMARNMGKLAAKWGPEEDFGRAGGNVICKDCGLEYLEHPDGSEPWMTLLCNGKQVKL